MNFKKKLESGEPIEEPGLTIQECDRLSQKLKRSIKAITYALQEQEYPRNNPSELIKKQKQYLMDLLKSKKDIINEVAKSKIGSVVRELVKG